MRKRWLVVGATILVALGIALWAVQDRRVASEDVFSARSEQARRDYARTVIETSGHVCDSVRAIGPMREFGLSPIRAVECETGRFALVTSRDDPRAYAERCASMQGSALDAVCR